MSRVDIILLLIISFSAYGVTDLAEHLDTDIIAHDHLLLGCDHIDMAKMTTLFSSFSGEKEKAIH
ncbi:hypothetical protein [uncultured Shewanella sp.]|uniref:hypothetical protein n=1 Tax=uncultured Shewanella sp. TaxID=173975 RepID=UPI0026383910|nr:hypothetical protein [uncultured Shewanella sp.]